MVVGYVGSQLWQLVPVGHVCVLGTYVGMTVIDIFADKRQTLVAPMELYAAVQLTGKSAQSLQPAMESWLKLSTRWHSHTYAAQCRQWLNKSHQDDLAIQSVVQALYKLTPEPWVDIRMHVHTHHDLRATKLAESVLYAVGYIRSQSHLRLHR